MATSVIEKLISEGHDVLVYSRSANQRIDCQQIQGDIFDFVNFIKVFKWKPQVIVHTAWITTPGMYKNDPSNYRYAKFTIDLANYINQTEVEHLVVLGTCAEYGQQSGPSIAGFTKTSPINLYAEQKVHAFHSVKSILQKTSTRLTWARLFYPYGPYQHKKRLIPQIVDSLNRQNPIRLADTTSVYDWITTRDVASAISWIIHYELPVEIDVGTSIGYTNLNLLMILEELCQVKNHLTLDEEHAPGVGEIFVMGKDSPLLASGWLPKDTLQSGLNWALG